MAGIRAGISTLREYTVYHEYDVFTVYQLPYSWRSSGGWGATPAVEGSVGILHSQNMDVFIGTVGPQFAIDKSGIPLELALGLNFAFLSTPRIGRDSYEGNLQFISHVGVNYRFSRLVGIGYRFQHMSNGHIYGGFNSGLNMHVVCANFYLDE